MMKSMTTVKITVSLPEELVAQARRAVTRGTARSVSAYVADALRQMGAAGDALLADIEEALGATGGPPTPEEEAWLDSIFRE
jgi:antitoxin ParD1/3/4